MTGRLSSFFLVFVCSVGYLLGGMLTGMTASAADTVGTLTLTASETRALFGDEIECTYFNGSEYVDAKYTYSSVVSTHPNISGSELGTNTVWIRYNGRFSANTNPNYITLHLKPSVSFIDTYEVHGGLGVRSASSIPSSPPFNSSHWEIYQNGVKSLFPLVGSESDGVFTPSTFIFNAPRNDVIVFAVDSIYSMPSTVSFGDVYLYGVSLDGSGSTTNNIYIACPTFSVTGASVTGIVTAPPGGGGGGGGSTIDYSPQLQEIIDKLDAIAEQNGYTDDEQDDIDDTDNSLNNQNQTIDGIEAGENDLFLSVDSATVGRWSAGVEAGEFPDLSLSGSYVKQGVTFGDSAFDVSYTALVDDASVRGSPAGAFSDFFSLLGNFPFFIIGIGLYLFSVILHTG